MTKNTGKSSEALFEAMFLPLGKKAYLHRLTDAAEVYGMNRDKGLSRVKPQPADYIVTVEGQGTFLAEIKSTQNATSFSKNQIEQGQWFAAVRQVAAGGAYFFFLHALKLGKWFAVPAKVLIESGAKSWKWTDLEPFHVR